MTPGGFNMDNAIEASKKAVEKRNKDTFELIQTYDSVSDAARDIDIDRYETIRKNICMYCSQKTQIHEVYGYRWNYVGNKPDTIKRGEKRKKAIYMCDKNTHCIIKEFASAKDAANYLSKVNGGNITACCKGRAKTAYGYFWQYKEENDNE